MTADLSSTPEYVIFHNLERKQPHNPLGAWPLHITITPPFELPVEDATTELLRLMRDIARDYTPFCIYADKRDKFGPNNTVDVTRVISPSGELQLLHERLVRGIGTLGCTKMDTRWALEKYSPHVKDQDGHALTANIIRVDTFTLAQKSAGQREIIETIDL